MRYKKLVIPALFILLLIAIFDWSILYAQKFNDFQDGDLIFQTSTSSQSQAIQLATNSPYSHCGIIYRVNGKLYVYEAVQTVRFTPLNDWIKRGKNGHYVIKRLKNADKLLTPDALSKLKKTGVRFNGKSYDLVFAWSDEEIYCSELIYKIYNESLNIRLGELQTLGDFNLSHPAVKIKLQERYGNKIPLSETVISPDAIFQSPLLVTVFSK